MAAGSYVLFSIAEPSVTKEWCKEPSRSITRDYNRVRASLVLRSAEPRFADNARDFFSNQPFDDAGKMFIKPGLQ